MSNMFNSKFYSRATSLAPQGKPILIAFSGGPDSVYVAHMLLEMFPVDRVRLAHFDHAVREGSDKDAQWCTEWAKARNVECYIGRWNDSRADEDSMRRARYAFLNHMREQLDAEMIVMGTHRDDVVETILHNFLRGSGVKGLRGPLEWRADLRIWRPLLTISKQEILQKLEQEGLEYLIDPSNEDQQYARNYLRLTVLPELEQHYPRLRERLIEQAGLMALHESYLSEGTRRALDTIRSREGEYSRQKYRELHSLEQLAVIRATVGEGLRFVQALGLQRFILSGASGKKAIVGKRSVELSQDTWRVKESSDL